MNQLLLGYNSWPSQATFRLPWDLCPHSPGSSWPQVEGTTIWVGEGKELLHKNSGLALVSLEVSRDQTGYRRQPSGVVMVEGTLAPGLMRQPAVLLGATLPASLGPQVSGWC